MKTMEIQYFNHSLSNKRKYISHKPQLDTDSLIYSFENFLFDLNRKKQFLRDKLGNHFFIVFVAENILRLSLRID